jgi:hypothetical protein
LGLGVWGKTGFYFSKNTPPHPRGRGISADVTWSEKYDKGSKKKKNGKDKRKNKKYTVKKNYIEQGEK